MKSFNTTILLASLSPKRAMASSVACWRSLKEIIESEHLKPQETKTFIDNSFRDGQVRTSGTDIDKILPPMSRFGGGNRQEKKKSVIEKIQAFFERYFGL